ncbi:hypothetical protein LCGC14_0365440 [marine sediment metagenome]|uniref:Uncharacterized protein n=1 Tax=marine sediment metagenome TaxID=412755 RepID=A0A0F9WF43_9ZZZZ
MGTPICKVYLWSGTTVYNYTFDSTNVLLGVKHLEQPYNQQATVIIDNYDGGLTDVDLKGYSSVLSYGYYVDGDLYSPTAPLTVVSQELQSATGPTGRLTNHLSLVGIPNLIGYDEANADFEILNGDGRSVKDFLEEIVSKEDTATTGTESQEEADSDMILHSGVLYYAGQELTIAYRTVDTLTFKLKKVGTPTGNITFYIDDADGSELGSKVLGNASALTTSYAEKTVTFDSPIVINTAGKNTKILCEFTGGDVNNYVSFAYEKLQSDADGGGSIKTGENLVTLYTSGWESHFGRDAFYKYTYQLTSASTPFSHCIAYEIDYDTSTAGTLLETYQPKDALRIDKGSSRLEIIKTLLRLTGFSMRAGDDGDIHIFQATTSGGSYDYQYSLAAGSHVFFTKGWRQKLVIPAIVSVSSRPFDTSQYAGTATDTSVPVPLRKTEYIELFLASNAQASAVATARLGHYQIDAEGGFGSVPMNCGQEVYDYILITDSREGGSTRIGNIGQILRVFEPNKWQMDFRFGGIEAPVELIGIGSGTTATTNFVSTSLFFAYINDIYADLQYVKDQIPVGDGQKAIHLLINYGFYPIPKGEKGHIFLPFKGNILYAFLYADQTGYIVVDIWKDIIDNFPPTVADTIVASAPLTLSNAEREYNTTLTGWTTAFLAGDLLAYNIKSFDAAESSTWVADTVYAGSAKVKPITDNGYEYIATVGGTSGASEPAWPWEDTITDGTVTWGLYCTIKRLSIILVVEETT